MGWLLPGIVLLVLAHRAVEGIVCSSGNKARRRLVWNLATAALLLAMVAAAWVVILFRPQWRDQFGAVVIWGTPVALMGILIFVVATNVAYEQGEFDRGADDGEGDGE